VINYKRILHHVERGGGSLKSEDGENNSGFLNLEILDFNNNHSDHRRNERLQSLKKQYSQWAVKARRHNARARGAAGGYNADSVITFLIQSPHFFFFFFFFGFSSSLSSSLEEDDDEEDDESEEDEDEDEEEESSESSSSESSSSEELESSLDSASERFFFLSFFLSFSFFRAFSVAFDFSRTDDA